MNGREKLTRQKTVVGHGVQHARLTEQHHEHHAGEPG